MIIATSDEGGTRKYCECILDIYWTETYLYALKVVLIAVIVVHEPAPDLNHVLHALPSELLVES